MPMPSCPLKKRQVGSHQRQVAFLIPNTVRGHFLHLPYSGLTLLANRASPSLGLNLKILRPILAPDWWKLWILFRLVIAKYFTMLRNKLHQIWKLKIKWFIWVKVVHHWNSRGDQLKSWGFCSISRNSTGFMHPLNICLCRIQWIQRILRIPYLILKDPLSLWIQWILRHLNNLYSEWDCKGFKGSIESVRIPWCISWIFWVQGSYWIP